jgi:hypothetical protein
MDPIARAPADVAEAIAAIRRANGSRTQHELYRVAAALSALAHEVWDLHAKTAAPEVCCCETCHREFEVDLTPRASRPGTCPACYHAATGETSCLTVRYLDKLNASVVVATMPEGYRWATEEETENWTEHQDRMVQVQTCDTAQGPMTDLAIRE